MIHLIPEWGLTFHKSHGMTCGAGCDAACAVVRPAEPSFEKSRTGGRYFAFSMAKSAGRGVYGAPGFGPSAIYVQALCSRERPSSARITKSQKGATARQIGWRLSPKIRRAGTRTFFPGPPK